MTEQVQTKRHGAGHGEARRGRRRSLAAASPASICCADLPIWLRWIIVLAALALGTLVGLQSAPGPDVLGVRAGLAHRAAQGRVADRQETLQVTLVVFVMIIVLGLFFWGLDSLLGVAHALADRAGG